MKFVLKASILFFTMLIILVVLTINFNLYYSPKIINSENIEIKQQINFLWNYIQIKNGGNKMQAIFPEGKVFIYSLTGLAICDHVSAIKDKTAAQTISYVSKIDSLINLLHEEDTKNIFPEITIPKYGIFYNGWKNYLIQKRLGIQNDEFLKNQYIANCNSIIKAFKDTKKMYLPSYINETWPADNIVAIASLHDFQFIDSAKYFSFIKSWIEDLQTVLTENEILIPHKVATNSNEILSTARGCSSALINCFLMEIDTQIATQQYALFKEHFLTKRFGLLGSREFEAFDDKDADIDSGPVIFGIGASASITACKAAAVNKDWHTFTLLQKNIEAFGFPFSSMHHKKYLFESLPIADAFIAWVNSGASQQIEIKIPWFFHLISITVLLICYRIISRLLVKNNANTMH